MEQVEDTWSIPANLRWLAEQSDRPGYVPCGELTGRFLNLTADRFEALATRTTDQAKDEEIARYRAALEAVASIKVRIVEPWTHETAADVYSVELDRAQNYARRALKDKPNG